MIDAREECRGSERGDEDAVKGKRCAQDGTTRDARDKFGYLHMTVLVPEMGLEVASLTQYHYIVR